MPFTNQTEEKQIERAVLVGLSCPSFNTDQDADERTMDELRALAETAGAEAVAMTLQRRPAPDARTFIGEGKAEEVKQLAEMNDASLILFDNELSPSQMSNLEELTGRTVLDRSALILDIFAQRARTGEGKLQVELAQYQYILPRLAGMGKAMSRLGGGIGTRGPGESKLESDRRHIRSRINKLRRDLEQVRQVRSVQRRQRKKAELPLVAIVGYTNAGKSTLLYKIVLDLVASGVDWEQIIYINFEDERLSEFTVADFNDLLSVQSEMSDKKGYFFLDEVQNIDGWEKFARRMADAKEHIYITGSNAKMLSREIETTLGGRFFAKHITPYAFGEYLTACEVPHDEPALLGTKTNGKIRAACAQYLQYGGLPESLLYKAKREYISGVYQKVLLGDIITRNSIRNDYAVKILIKKIAESVRSEISYSKLQKTLRAVNVSLAKDTIADYIRYAEDAYLLFHLQNYYANLVEKESYPKFYFSDNGIVSLFLDRKESVQLENMAAVALARAYPDDVYYLKSAKTGIDIDFYVPSIGLAVQAAYSIAGDAREREVGSLKKLAQNSQGAARLVIVTYEEEETIIEDGVTIEAVPLYKFLLELESGKYGAAY